MVLRSPRQKAMRWDRSHPLGEVRFVPKLRESSKAKFADSTHGTDALEENMHVPLPWTRAPGELGVACLSCPRPPPPLSRLTFGVLVNATGVGEEVRMYREGGRDWPVPHHVDLHANHVLSHEERRAIDRKQRV